MSYSSERRQAYSSEYYKDVGKDPKESLPKPSPWIKTVFQDEELKNALLTSAFDVIEASWAAVMPDDYAVHTELHQRRVAYQNEHTLPVPIDSMNPLYQKFFYWKFNETLSTAATQCPEFQKMIKGVQTGAITREEILSSESEDSIGSDVVLLDYSVVDR